MKNLKLTSLVLASMIGASLTIIAAPVTASAQVRTNNPPSNNAPNNSPPSSHHTEAAVIDCRELNNCPRRFPSIPVARQDCKRGLWEDKQPGFVAEHQYMCMHKHLVPVAD